MMTRVMLAMTFVIASILIGGAIGGFVGHEVGRYSPQFVGMIAGYGPESPRPRFRPEEFGLGLGIVSGLFFGAGSSLILVVVMGLRDAWIARHAARTKLD